MTEEIDRVECDVLKENVKEKDMAGIEKVCEFSGEYRGPEMYAAKRNQLQVLPEYRKVFRKAQHILHIFKPKQVWFDGSCSWDYDAQDMEGYEPPFTSEKEYVEYIKWKMKARIVNDFDYALEVFDETLKGEVGGIYLNWSKDISSVKRKIKRLLRVQKLVIQKHDCSYWEWKEAKD